MYENGDAKHKLKQLLHTCTCIPYEIFEPDRDGIQPDSGRNTVLGVKHQPDMNLTKKCLALCWRAGQVSGLCPAEVWPDGTPTRA